MAKINLGAAVQMDDEEQEKLPLVSGSLSLQEVKPQFDAYVKNVDSMLEKAKAIVISDDATLQTAVSLGGEAKKISKLIDAQREKVIAEAKGFVDSVNGFCKLFTEKLISNPKKTNACIESILKKKITDYQTKIELERRKAEDAAKKASEDLQKQINKDAKAAGVEAPQVPTPIMPKQETVVRTESGTSAFQSKRWVCTIIDPSLVPRQFCEPSQKLLNEAVKQGVREIAGCKIEETSDTRFRS